MQSACQTISHPQNLMRDGPPLPQSWFSPEQIFLDPLRKICSQYRPATWVHTSSCEATNGWVNTHQSKMLFPFADSWIPTVAERSAVSAKQQGAEMKTLEYIIQCVQFAVGQITASGLISSKYLLRTLVESTVEYLEKWLGFHEYASAALQSVCGVQNATFRNVCGNNAACSQ